MRTNQHCASHATVLVCRFWGKSGAQPQSQQGNANLRILRPFAPIGEDAVGDGDVVV